MKENPLAPILNGDKPYPIPQKELLAFYQEVGRTIAEWLGSLECPTCKNKSDLDWMLKQYSNGKPQLLCRHCGRTFIIPDLKFKCIKIKADSYIDKKFSTLTNKLKREPKRLPLPP